MYSLYLYINVKNYSWEYLIKKGFGLAVNVYVCNDVINMPYIAKFTVFLECYNFDSYFRTELTIFMQ